MSPPYIGCADCKRNAKTRLKEFFFETGMIPRYHSNCTFVPLML